MPNASSDRRDEFIKDRKYLLNVSDHTVSWYRHALYKWLPSDSPSDAELKSTVIRMREAGLKPTGCNAAIRAINAYLKWAGSGLKVPKLKEPQTVMPTFTEAQVTLLLKHRATSFYGRRLHLLVLLLLDCGCRISEALNIRVEDLNADDLLLTLHGKGRKDRIVPISLEFRKAVFRYIRDYSPKGWLLASKGGDRLGRCVMLRNVKDLCRDLGFEPPPRTLHAFRHTWAVNYVRQGGSVFHLQQALGHSTLEMSRRYSCLNTADLSAMQETTSILRRLG